MSSDGIEEASIQPHAMRLVMASPMLNERLKRFQGLARALETDGAGQEVVFGRRLRDDRADEARVVAVCEIDKAYVRP